MSLNFIRRCYSLLIPSFLSTPYLNLHTLTNTSRWYSQSVHLLHQPEFNPCTVFIAAPPFEVAKRMLDDGIRLGLTKNARSVRRCFVALCCIVFCSVLFCPFYSHNRFSSRNFFGFTSSVCQRKEVILSLDLLYRIPVIMISAAFSFHQQFFTVMVDINFVHDISSRRPRHLFVSTPNLTCFNLALFIVRVKSRSGCRSFVLHGEFSSKFTSLVIRSESERDRGV